LSTASEAEIITEFQGKYAAFHFLEPIHRMNGGWGTVSRSALSLLHDTLINCIPTRFFVQG